MIIGIFILTMFAQSIAFKECYISEHMESLEAEFNYTVCFFYSVLFGTTFIPRPEGYFVNLIRNFTHYEWPFEMFTKIFGGLLKIKESTGSDKDEEVQRRTAEVYSENLRNTKLCHSSSTRVPASLWNQGRKKKVAVHSKRL